MRSSGFLLQCTVGGDQHKLLSPTVSYSLNHSKNIYDAEVVQNWFYNMTQDLLSPSLGEKRC